MMTSRNILLLVLGIGMIQEQILVASKLHLVETKHKHYLVETAERKGAKIVSTSSIY